MSRPRRARNLSVAEHELLGRSRPRCDLPSQPRTAPAGRSSLAATRVQSPPTLLSFARRRF
eukprot:6169031-Heterocapsa_arctica.AAC.1